VIPIHIFVKCIQSIHSFESTTYLSFLTIMSFPGWPFTPPNPSNSKKPEQSRQQQSPQNGASDLGISDYLYLKHAENVRNRIAQRPFTKEEIAKMHTDMQNMSAEEAAQYRSAFKARCKMEGRLDIAPDVLVDMYAYNEDKPLNRRLKSALLVRGGIQYTVQGAALWGLWRVSKYVAGIVRNWGVTRMSQSPRYADHPFVVKKMTELNMAKQPADMQGRLNAQSFYEHRGQDGNHRVLQLLERDMYLRSALRQHQ